MSVLRDTPLSVPEAAMGVPQQRWTDRWPITINRGWVKRKDKELKRKKKKERGWKLSILSREISGWSRAVSYVLSCQWSNNWLQHQDHANADSKGHIGSLGVAMCSMPCPGTQQVTRPDHCPGKQQATRTDRTQQATHPDHCSNTQQAKCPDHCPGTQHPDLVHSRPHGTQQASSLSWYTLTILVHSRPVLEHTRPDHCPGLPSWYTAGTCPHHCPSRWHALITVTHCLGKQLATRPDHYPNTQAKCPDHCPDTQQATCPRHCPNTCHTRPRKLSRYMAGHTLWPLS